MSNLFLDLFKIELHKTTIINKDKNTILYKREIGELIGELFAQYSWGIMDDITFDLLKDVIENTLGDCTLIIDTLNEQRITGIDANALAKQIIKVLRSY